MPTKMKVPPHISSLSFGGEEYTPEDGFVTVPNTAVPHFASHGVYPHGEKKDLLETAGKVLEPDDEFVGDGDDGMDIDPVVPSAMTKKELIAYHKEHDLSYPTPTTVGKLRESVARHRQQIKDNFDTSDKSTKSDTSGTAASTTAAE